MAKIINKCRRPKNECVQAQVDHVIRAYIGFELNTFRTQDFNPILVNEKVEN